mmetsp:Transcript_53349/g.159749  ORF Transcript_53349/g.159749 Transcript_53349/m.159749 type:complete len:312 (-) Transcript_53349:51-986(-)
MNSLQTNSDKWIGDGSDGKLTVDGGQMSFGSAKSGTPFNIRLDDESIAPTGSLFYEVEVVELNGTLGIGAITRDNFLPGWKSKGIFYNGNLTNGSAALLCSFGERAAVGDTVGLFIKRNDGQLKTFFYFNKKCLGEAFRLDGETDVFYPCLHLDGNCVVKYRSPDSFPSETNRQPSERADAYCGDWELTKAFDGPELYERALPKDEEIILNFHQTGGKSYHLSVKVGNSMRTTVNITGELEAFDEINVGMVMSTRKMPPPELMDFERFLSSKLPEMRKMIVGENGELVMCGVTVELLAKRYEKHFEPLTEY